MIGCKLFLFLFLISSTFLIHNALKYEEIIGGYPALQSEFKYQAAIIGIYNHSRTSYLLCSAGIISNYLIISAARCFMHTITQIRKLTFFAVVGEYVLVARDIDLKEIDKIYTYYYTNFGIKHDLAISRLKQSLNLENRMDLVALEIPSEEETFDGAIGVVAGFGISSINELTKNQFQEQIRINANSFLLLKYANVTVMNIREFEDKLDFVCGDTSHYFTDICGRILPDEAYEHRGICRADIGAPLVLGKKVIGIVSKHRKDCDDTIRGSRYTRVSKLKTFINALIEGRLIRGINVIENLLHVPFSRIRNSTVLIN